jgi:MoaA/NifB/PqqE/SkfB family radical SAM enzyme
MTMADWMRVIDQAAALRVSLVQFIGGEPTLHPHLPALIQHALSRMMEVEVYTNLSHVSEGLWRLLERDRIGLTVTVDGRHRIWLDTPNSEHAWDPAHHPTSETSH